MIKNINNETDNLHDEKPDTNSVETEITANNESSTVQSPAQSTAESKNEYPHKRSISKIIKRYIVLCVGLFIMSFGVGLSVKATLGTSPISSIPNVLNIITGLTVGTTTIIFNVLLVVLQIIILRKRFDPIQLIQIPVSIAFGFLCDFALWCLNGMVVESYWSQWMVCGAGILLVALGVSMEVAGNVATLPGEGTVLALCRITPIKFGYMKVICDSSMVVIAAALILIFHHKLEGVREGTVAAAILVGLIAKLFNKFMLPLSNLFYYGKLKGITN